MTSLTLFFVEAETGGLDGALRGLKHKKLINRMSLYRYAHNYELRNKDAEQED